MIKVFSSLNQVHLFIRILIVRYLDELWKQKVVKYTAMCLELNVFLSALLFMFLMVLFLDLFFFFWLPQCLFPWLDVSSLLKYCYHGYIFPLHSSIVRRILLYTGVLLLLHRDDGPCFVFQIHGYSFTYVIQIFRF